MERDILVVLFFAFYTCDSLQLDTLEMPRAEVPIRPVHFVFHGNYD